MYVQIQITGMHVVTGNNMIMEIVESDGNTRLFQRNNSMFPLRINHVTATYTSGTILACGGWIGPHGRFEKILFRKSLK